MNAKLPVLQVSAVIAKGLVEGFSQVNRSMFFQLLWWWVGGFLAVVLSTAALVAQGGAFALLPCCGALYCCPGCTRWGLCTTSLLWCSLLLPWLHKVGSLHYFLAVVLSTAALVAQGGAFALPAYSNIGQQDGEFLIWTRAIEPALNCFAGQLSYADSMSVHWCKCMATLLLSDTHSYSAAGCTHTLSHQQFEVALWLS